MIRSLGLVLTVLLCVATQRTAQAEPVADTALIDQRGQTFTLRSLRGKPVVLSFIATQCTDVCPIADAVFAELRHDHSGVQLLSVTLNPHYDTPFVMSRYARKMNARAPQWRVASGKPATIDRFLDKFGVTRFANNVHSTFVYCLDARGRLARMFALSTLTERDVRAWLTSTV